MNDPCLHFEKTVCGVTLLCDLIPMGQDVTLCVRSDPGGHVGSTALAVARPSLTGQGISATTSVLNCLGHKDDAVAIHLAEAVSIAKNCTAVCTCGIHVDGLSQEGIRAVLTACREIEEEILRVLTQQPDNRPEND